MSCVHLQAMLRLTSAVVIVVVVLPVRRVGGCRVGGLDEVEGQSKRFGLASGFRSSEDQRQGRAFWTGADEVNSIAIH